MPSHKLLLPLALALFTGIIGFWFLSKPEDSPVTNNPTPSPTSSKRTAPAANNSRLGKLAQHHCARLATELSTNETQVEQCITTVLNDAKAGKIKPEIPTFDPAACNEITDPAEQHKCFGWMGHDFAVSTNDIERCQSIPMPDIQSACQRAILVNEIKTLHAMQQATDSESLQP